MTTGHDNVAKIIAYGIGIVSNNKKSLVINSLRSNHSSSRAGCISFLHSNTKLRSYVKTHCLGNPLSLTSSIQSQASFIYLGAMKIHPFVISVLSAESTYHSYRPTCSVHPYRFRFVGRPGFTPDVRTVIRSEIQRILDPKAVTIAT